MSWNESTKYQLHNPKLGVNNNSKDGDVVGNENAKPTYSFTLAFAQMWEKTINNASISDIWIQAEWKEHR